VRQKIYKNDKKRTKFLESFPLYGLNMIEKRENDTQFQGDGGSKGGISRL